MLHYHKLQLGVSFLLLLLYGTACSTPQPQNKWQYDAVSMCHNYQIHFLQDKTIRATLDLRHARELASRSAELKTLIDIELTSCAMESSALNQGQCQEAERLLRLDNDPSQDAYFSLLTSQISEDKVSLLPSQYRTFAEALIGTDKRKINKALSDIKPLTSRLIASALAKESINDVNIKELIDGLSYHGYKRPLLVWLDVQMQREEDAQKKARLKEKIEVLTSN